MIIAQQIGGAGLVPGFEKQHEILPGKGTGMEKNNAADILAQRNRRRA
jgi:hypothetical protein